MSKSVKKMTEEEIFREMAAIEEETIKLYDHLMFDPSPFLGEQATADWDNHQQQLLLNQIEGPSPEDNPRYRALLAEVNLRWKGTPLST